MGDTILASLILPERKSADSGSLKSALTIGAGRSSRPGSCLVECKRRKGCTLYTTHRDNLSTRYLLLYTTSPHQVLTMTMDARIAFIIMTIIITKTITMITMTMTTMTKIHELHHKAVVYIVLGVQASALSPGRILSHK